MFLPGSCDDYAIWNKEKEAVPSKQTSRQRELVHKVFYVKNENIGAWFTNMPWNVVLFAY